MMVSQKDRDRLRHILSAIISIGEYTKGSNLLILKANLNGFWIKKLYPYPNLLDFS